MLTYPDSRTRKLNPWLLFLCSSAAIPLWFLIVASNSGQNHFGQGLEGPLFSFFKWLVQLVCLCGCTLAPLLSSFSKTKKAVLAVAGCIGFLVIDLLSFAFIGFGMFPD
jgi:hypothetical protein